MRLSSLAATPHPDGHRVVLTWANPLPAEWPAVRVVRREGTHPQSPADGVVVLDGAPDLVGTDAAGATLHRLEDGDGLRGGAVYYYALFPARGDPPELSADRANRVASLSAARHGMAAEMYALLPAIYGRYDAGAEPLRRFLQIPGGQLDVLWSYAAALLDAHDPDRVEGGLLPLLAEWIGWKTDQRLELSRQRSEVRAAPALYGRIGRVPAVAATVRRISGWESRTKEFVHNVQRSNQPPRLNLWARLLPGAGAPGPETLLSMDYAFDGRPSAVVDEHGIRWIFYHTRRLGRWRIWHKSSPTFALGPEALPLLAGADVAGLQAAFLAAGVELAADATVAPEGAFWRVEDATNGHSYAARADAGGTGVTVYRTSATALEWAPSRPVDPRAGPRAPGDEKAPAAAVQGGTTWLFWPVVDSDGRWSIRYRTRREGAWSVARAFDHGAPAGTERRAPSVAVDGDGALWLFWLQRAGGRWTLRYNRYPAAGLGPDGPDPDAWALAAPAELPLDGGADPRVEGDPFVLFLPGAPARPLWVFWARRVPGSEPGQTRWSIVFRFKGGTNPAAADWGEVRPLPKPDAQAHDREPAARVTANGRIEVFWASDRGGGWAAWRAGLNPAPAPPTRSAAASLTPPPYARRDPLPVPVGDDVLLLYRSNESVRYQSAVYGATETTDFRYAGSMTAHVRDSAALALRGALDDFARYTFDTRTGNDDWYRRDTVGVYLSPAVMDPDVVDRGVERLRRVLPEFMPATDRAVFVPRHDLHTELVYAYDQPGAPEPYFVAESWSDALDAPLAEAAPAPGEEFTDELA
jgi:phage tail-like protein